MSRQNHEALKVFTGDHDGLTPEGSKMKAKPEARTVSEPRPSEEKAEDKS